jgi:transposase
LVKRLISQELVVSFVPDSEQRLWRTLMRTRYQRTRDKVRLQNQLEALLEKAHIKLSSLVSDLLGVSARRMLKALADGETDPAALAALADQRLRATPEQLRDALGACAGLNPVYRQLVKMALADLQLIEQQIGQLDQEMASLLSEHQDAVQRLAEVPGLGVDSAQQIIAEVGAKAATFASAKNLVSVGRSMPGRRRERPREPQQTFAERQPSDAPHSQSGCQCCRQTQREHLRDRLSSSRTPVRTQQNHRSRCVD